MGWVGGWVCLHLSPLGKKPEETEMDLQSHH